MKSCIILESSRESIVPWFVCCFSIFRRTYNYHYHIMNDFANPVVVLHDDEDDDDDMSVHPNTPVSPATFVYPPPLRLDDSAQSMFFMPSNEDENEPIQLIETIYDGSDLTDITPDHIHIEHITHENLVYNHYPYLYEPSRTTIPESE